jgi:hypothetical protein
MVAKTNVFTKVEGVRDQVTRSVETMTQMIVQNGVKSHLAHSEKLVIRGTAFQLAKMNVIVDKEDVQATDIKYAVIMIQTLVQNGAKLLLVLSVRSAITEYVSKFI